MLSTKFRPPTLPPDFVPRPRVNQRLDRGNGCRLTVVHAPAGFGKTIALAGWLQQVRRPWVWVGLDEFDDDLVSFTRLLVSALRTVIPRAGRQVLALAAQTERPALSELSALLVQDLAEFKDGLILVLDDFHLIQDPSIHALLSLVIRRLPQTVQLVIASREEPALPLALLRGRRELAEVQIHDLRFDRPEAIAFVSGMRGVALDHRLVADAVDRAEGWAVGLRLLTLVSVPSEVSQTGSTPLASREHQVVDGFLFEEVLSRQTPEVRRFLTQISILARFCTPLCEAVVDGLQPGDAQRLLKATLSAGLFVVSLDGEQHWFRFHELFRAALRRRLEHETDRERVRAMRLRASDWLAGQGLWDEAAAHAIRVGDIDRITALVETCLLTDRSISADLMLESWIRRLPPDVVAASPTLLLARCGTLGHRGEVDELERQLHRVEAMLSDEPSRVTPALLPIAQGQIAAQLGWVLYQKGGADQDAHDRVARALDLLPTDQYDHRGLAAATYAIVWHCLGRTDEALAWIAAELSQSTALHADYTARLLVAQLNVEVASGRLAAAAHTGRRMVAFGSAHAIGQSIGWGHFGQAQVAYEWNDLDGAREHFEAVLALGQEAQRMCTVNATLGLAQTLVAQGQSAEAERLVREELAQAEEAQHTFFVDGYRSCLARLALVSDDPDRAAYWLAGVTFSRQGLTSYNVENPLLTRARVLVAMATSSGSDEAIAAVDRAIEAAEGRHVTASLVQGLALRALIEQSRGEISHAARSLARALEVAAPGRFTRTFVDLGPPLVELLVELASRGSLPPGGARVLDVCRAEVGAVTSRPSGREPVAPNAINMLTRREHDVLQLMDGHFTNREIARQLHISEETVKKHAASIYSKLEAKGRRDAVIRAHDLGILRAETRRVPRSG